MRPKVLLITILSTFLVLLTVLGFALPVDFAVAVALGWIWYLGRTYPEVHVASEGIATAAVCLVLFVVGTHVFLVWLYRGVRNATGVKSSFGAERWKWRWTASLAAVIVLMFVAGISVVGITHQLGWLLKSEEPWVVNSGSAASGAAARTHSLFNLKQIGLALHLYNSNFESLPPGGTFDREGRALHSWQTLILPYLEHGELYDRIDVTVPWHHSRNIAAFQTEVRTYLRPGFKTTRNAAGYGLSHYAANVYVLGGTRARQLDDVIDGTANTIIAGEVIAEFKPWGNPTNWRDPSLGVNADPRGFGSPSPGGVNFLMADGSVRFIKNSVDPKVLKALATPAGGETVSSDQY